MVIASGVMICSSRGSPIALKPPGAECEHDGLELAAVGVSS
jgi:hypothetical protein